MALGWSAERVELLKKLWGEGYSCTLIGVRMGVSRNAVIGKVSRLGLQPRLSGPRKIAKRRKPKRLPKTQENRFPTGNPIFRALCADAAPLVLAVEIDIPVAERKSLIDLDPHHCRWPIGDPQHAFPEFYFCGREKVPGLSYCEHHCRRAFQPPEARISKRARAKKELVNG